MSPEPRSSGAGSSRGTHIGSIVHITDTHLFMDRDGKANRTEQRSRLVRLLARLGVHDLEYASAESVARLAETLSRAVAAERKVLSDRAPVIVVHSGDAEAFGTIPGIGEYSGFSLLASVFASSAPDGVVAVYGNHDVWLGSVALFGLNGPSQGTLERAIATGVDMIGSLPPTSPLRFPTPDGPTIAFVPLNSVDSRAIRGGLLACGRLSPHPPGSGDVVDRLRSLGLRPADLNIAVMHHPPHFNRPVTLRDRMGMGRLQRSRPVATELHESGINLVLAGHRHRLDPPFGERLDATAGGQPPLPPGTAQLVALSPTLHSHERVVDVDPPGSPRRGLCIYRVMADPLGTSVTIGRIVHSTDGPDCNESTFEPAVISRIPLG